MQKRTLGWVSLVGLLAALVWLVSRRGWPALAPGASPAAEPGASGVIAASEIALSSLHGGTIRLDGLHVAEGDTVQAGQELAALDTALPEAGIGLAEAQLAVAQAALEQLEAGARPGVIAAATQQLEQARAAQAAAAQALADARALRDEPQQLDMQVALSAARVEAAEQHLQSAIALKDAAAVSKGALEYAQGQIRDWPYPVPPPDVPAELDSALWDWWKAWAGLNAAQASLDDARAQLDHWRAVREQPQEPDARVQTAEAALAQADAAVDAAQAQLDACRAGAGAGQLDVARARVSQASAALDALVAQRAEWSIVAPISGTVLSRAVRAGEVVAAGGTVLSLADLSQVKLTAYVAEDRLGEIALNQPVRVTVDAFPGRTFDGRVTHIADEAQYTPRNVATQAERVNTVYAVEILLPNDNGLLRPGMTADARWDAHSDSSAPAAVLMGSRVLADEPLRASGVLQLEEIRIASELAGYAAQVPVQSGNRVAQGDVLVVLESSAVRGSSEAADAALATAEAELARVSAQPRAEELAIRRAQLAVARAEKDGAWSAWQTSLRALREPQQLDGQILTARGQVALAAQSVQLAAAEQAAARSAADAADWGGTERQALEFQARAADAALAAARADERVAQVALRHLQAIRDNPLALQAAANAALGTYNVAAAALAVEQARLDDLQAGATAQELAVAAANVRLAQAQQNLARTQQSRLTLRAPVDGTVVARMVQVGETVLPGVTLLTVADLSEVYLTAYVPASRLGEVRPGQPVDVTVDSFPSRSFTGQVMHIAGQPQYTPRNVATQEERVNTVYGVKIRLPNAEGLLKPGMAGDVVFR